MSEWLCGEEKGQKEEERYNRTSSCSNLKSRYEEGLESLHLGIKVGVKKEGKRQAPLPCFGARMLALRANTMRSRLLVRAHTSIIWEGGAGK